MIRRAPWAADVLAGTHLDALHTSSALTSYFRRKHQPGATMVTPEAVIDVLHKAGVRFVLMGTHALNTWRSQARATQDVDVLVTKRDLRKALRVLREAYPTLQVQDLPVVARLVDPATNLQVIDVMKPTQTVFQMVFRYTLRVGDRHRIPTLEMALASKFAAMVSPNRAPEKRLIDAGDFMDVVKHNRPSIDDQKLQRFAEWVYPGGGEEIRKILEDIDAGRIIRL